MEMFGHIRNGGSLNRWYLIQYCVFALVLINFVLHNLILLYLFD